MSQARSSAGQEKNTAATSAIQQLNDGLDKVKNAFAIELSAAYGADARNVFESIVEYMHEMAGVANEFSEIDQFFNGYLKDFEHHLEHACSQFQFNHSTLSRESTNALTMIVKLYWLSMRQECLLKQYECSSSSSYHGQMAELVDAAKAIKRTLKFTDDTAIDKSMAFLSSTIQLLQDVVKGKGFIALDIEVDLQQYNWTKEKGYRDLNDALTKATTSLALLPSVASMQEGVDRCNNHHESYQVRNDLRLLRVTRQDVYAIASLLKDNLSSLVFGLMQRELRCQTYNTQLQGLGELIRTRSDMLYLYGKQRKNDDIDQFGELVSICAKLKKLTTKSMHAVIDQFEVCFKQEAKRVSGPYLAFDQDLDVLRREIDAAKQRLHATDDVCTRLITHVAKAELLLNTLLAKLDRLIEALDSYIEPTHSEYAKQFVTKNWREIGVGGSAGMAVSTAIGLLFAIKPEVAILAVAGGVLGSAGGVGVGLAKEQFGAKEADDEVQFTIELIDRSKLKALLQQPENLLVQDNSNSGTHHRWPLSFSIFNHIKEDGQKSENDDTISKSRLPD